MWVPIFSQLAAKALKPSPFLCISVLSSVGSLPTQLDAKDLILRHLTLLMSCLGIPDTSLGAYNSFVWKGA